MAESAIERKLAAILSADVEGYSRLMGADEEGTIEALRTSRRLIDEVVTSHRGRVFGSAGDSVIAEFASPVEAVRCAVEVQTALERDNAGLDEARRMRFRVGVNLGDVMVEGENLLGDGVNIAARLEALADAGGICISGTVHGQVRTSSTLATRISARRPSRTSPSRYPPTAFASAAGRPRPAPPLRRPTSPRSRSFPSTTWAAIPNKTISPTAYPRT